MIFNLINLILSGINHKTYPQASFLNGLTDDLGEASSDLKMSEGKAERLLLLVFPALSAAGQCVYPAGASVATLTDIRTQGVLAFQDSIRASASECDH